MTRLLTLAAELEAALEKVARCGAFLNEALPYKATEREFLTNCSVCGSEMVTHTERLRTKYIDYISWKLIVHLPRDIQTCETYAFPVCSEGCQLFGDRMIECLIQRRQKQWQKIVECRQLIQQVRALARKQNHAASQSQKKEYEQATTSQI